jgi:hypothetical protein
MLRKLHTLAEIEDFQRRVNRVRIPEIKHIHLKFFQKQAIQLINVLFNSRIQNGLIVNFKTGEGKSYLARAIMENPDLVSSNLVNVHFMSSKQVNIDIESKVRADLGDDQTKLSRIHFHSISVTSGEKSFGVTSTIIGARDIILIDYSFYALRTRS